eukprot:CAMPEP_0117449268 /NCGR_PEP_ID=MMETSP0759-20121206/7856_1 /TAXON_ID=63605 /ORGANISM="Percolomonas cosmopolitus, Strain WS" /LENGTH=300 /DNA_ID=CAMNT_0005241735 /DNA_START=19 /DNA_END=918 /DNA_ORIENTATION=-
MPSHLRKNTSSLITQIPHSPFTSPSLYIFNQQHATFTTRHQQSFLVFRSVGACLWSRHLKKPCQQCQTFSTSHFRRQQKEGKGSREHVDGAGEDSSADGVKDLHNSTMHNDGKEYKSLFEDSHSVHGEKPYGDILRRAQARLFLEEQKERRQLGAGSESATSSSTQNLTPEEEERRFERTIELMIKEDEANALLDSPYKLPFINHQQKEFSMQKELFRRPGEAVFMRQLVFFLFFLVGIGVLSHLFRKRMIALWRFSVHEDVMWIDDMSDSAGGMIISLPGYGQDVYIFDEDVEELKQLI